MSYGDLLALVHEKICIHWHLALELYRCNDLEDEDLARVYFVPQAQWSANAMIKTILKINIVYARTCIHWHLALELYGCNDLKDEDSPCKDAHSLSSWIEALPMQRS
nr:hypothetical protein CFP56_06222 [Quercus suber]